MANVYVVQVCNVMSHEAPTSYTVIAVRKSLESAKKFVERREGGELEWICERGHGELWRAEHSYRINNGPELTIHFGITVHSLES